MERFERCHVGVAMVAEDGTIRYRNEVARRLVDEADGLRVDDERSSRRHARVIVTPGGCRVEDLGSSNGTFLNGVLLPAGSPLMPGDRVRIGHSVIELRDAGAMGGTPPPSPGPPPLRAAPGRITNDPVAAPPPPGSGRPVPGQRSPESAIRALSADPASRRAAYAVTGAVIALVAVAVVVYLVMRAL